MVHASKGENREARGCIVARATGRVPPDVPEEHSSSLSRIAPSLVLVASLSNPMCTRTLIFDTDQMLHTIFTFSSHTDSTKRKRKFKSSGDKIGEAKVKGSRRSF